MSVARIFVVSNQDLFRIGVISQVQTDKMLIIVGEATSIEIAADSFANACPDVILFDLNNLEADHDFFCRTFEPHDELTKTIVFTAASTDYEHVHCLHAGVAGILSRNVGYAELLKSIQEALAGRVYYCG